MDELDVDVLAETDNFLITRTQDEDGNLYHIEMGGVTLHFAPEEWAEFVLLVKAADN